MAYQRHSDQLKSDPIGAIGWQVIYTGFVLILLTFFILLSSFASFEKAKVLQFVASFSNAVSILPGGVSISEGQRIASAAEEKSFQEEMRRIHRDMSHWIDAHHFGKHLELLMTKDGLTFRFDDGFLFSVASAALSIKVLPVLDRIGESILQTQYPVRIEGHTDNIPIRTRRYPSNWELSTARAVNVLRYFIKSSGIPADRLTAVGCGPYQPLADNGSWQGRAQNRRVEIIFFREE